MLTDDERAALTAAIDTIIHYAPSEENGALVAKLRAIAAPRVATVGDLLATAPTIEATAAEGTALAQRIGDTYDLTTPIGRGRAVAAMRLAESIITRGPIGEG